MLRDGRAHVDTQNSFAVSQRPKSARKASTRTASRVTLPSASDLSKLAAGRPTAATQNLTASGKQSSKRAVASQQSSPRNMVPSSRARSKKAVSQDTVFTQPGYADSRSSKRAKALTLPSPKNPLPCALTPSRDEKGHAYGVTHLDPADLIASIREIHRRRNDFLVEEGSLVRRMKRIVSRSTGQIKVTDSDLKEFIPNYPPMIPFVHSLEMITKARKQEEKLLKAKAEQLPVWDSFMSSIAGCGSLTLGQIIGDAGDLSKYSNPAKLWKRMGLAVFGGERQRKCKDKQLAELHGYNPRRRALMFIVGDNLIKLNKGEYRAIYDAEKKRQIEKAAAEGLQVAPGAKIPKGRAAEYRSEKHIHLRAKRYVEKRLLRNLWRAWRGQTCSVHHAEIAKS